MFDFHAKTMLVTGGGAGIGRAIAEAFGAAGARVAVAEIDPLRATQVREALQGAGVDALVVAADVRSTESVAALMAAVDERFGGLDVLVNNVGDFLRIVKPFEQCSDADIEAIYGINLRSVFAGDPCGHSAAAEACAGQQHHFAVIDRGLPGHPDGECLLGDEARDHRVYAQPGA